MILILLFLKSLWLGSQCMASGGKNPSLFRASTIRLSAYQSALAESFDRISPQRALFLDLENNHPSEQANTELDQALIHFKDKPDTAKDEMKKAIGSLEKFPLSRESRILYKSILTKMLELQLSAEDQLTLSRRLDTLEISLKPEVETLFHDKENGDGRSQANQLLEKLRTKIGWEDAEVFIDGEKLEKYPEVGLYDHYQWLFVSSAFQPLLVVGNFKKAEQTVLNEKPNAWIEGSCDKPLWNVSEENAAAVMTNSGCLAKYTVDRSTHLLGFNAEKMDEPSKRNWIWPAAIVATVVVALLWKNSGKELVFQMP